MLSFENLCDIREAIYSSVVATGRAPSAGSLASSHNLTTSQVEAAYRALADAHIIVLEPGSTDIRWAPPFSAVPTPFRVRAGDASWSTGSG